MRKNEKETDHPVGSEANLKASEMGRAIGSGGKASEGHGGSGGRTMTVWVWAGCRCGWVCVSGMSVSMAGVARNSDEYWCKFD